MADVGLAEYLFHPPLGILFPHLVTSGPYGPGSQQFTLFNGTMPVSNTYGMLIRMTTINPEAGYYDGFVSGDGQTDGNVYNRVLCQLGVQHQLGGGTWVVTQLVDVFNPFLPVLWETALPGRLGLYVPPGMAVDLYYLALF